MIAHLRLQNIEAEVRRRGSSSFDELLRQFEVSPATLRRDLTTLEAEGKVIRTHGGVMHPAVLKGEPDFTQKSSSNATAKRKIAAHVNSAISDNTTLFIDGGTTCLEAARLLLARPTLTLVTNSIPILSLAVQTEAKVIGIGGEVRKTSAALTGSDALQSLTKFKAEIALIGASALDDDQAFTSELTEAAVKQRMMERARTTWLLADQSKRRANAPVAFATLEQFDQLIDETTVLRRKKS